MAASAPPPTVGWERLIARLADSRPGNAGSQLHIGAGQAGEVDPQLLALVPQLLRPAAVLIGLVSAPEGPGILLTVRASHLRQHAGQISFPGGVIEPEDAGPAAAALREANEEVGLMHTEAQLLGFMPDQVVLTGFRITPVVAQIASTFVPRLAAAEVQGSFVLPLQVLLDPASERPSLRQIGGMEVAVRELHYGGHRIWGATAGMLFALRALARP